MNILIAPFVNALFGFYYLLGNLGWSIVAVTVVIRLLLLPLVIPSLKSAEKMRELQPKLKKLQEKFGKEKEKLAAAQMELYKTEGINPLSGCLPQILQIGVLLIFFSAFNMVVGFSEGKGSLGDINKQLIPAFQINEEFKFETNFLGNDLRLAPSKVWEKGVGMEMVLPLILLVGSGVLQYFSSKLMMPAPKVDKSLVDKTKDKEDDMMGMMRTQSLYMMPAMTIFIGWGFSIGMLLYWFVNSGVMLIQQLVVELGKKRN